MKYLKFFLLFILLSCSNNKNYETIVKDEQFILNIKLESDENIIDLKDGFTYYKNNSIISNKLPVVLVHGFSVPSYIWDVTYQKLNSEGFNVITLDLYGRGLSKNVEKDYTDELFANQVINLLDYLNIEKANFIGLSNGGRVISKITDLKSDLINSLVYVASSGFRKINAVENKKVTVKEIENFINEKYSTIAKGQLNDFKNPEKFNGWDTKYEQLLKYKGFANALISTTKNHYTMDEIHIKINDLNIPVYTIWGDSDQVVIYDEFSERLNNLLPKRNEYFVSNSGHLPHMENQDEFNKIILSILID